MNKDKEQEKEPVKKGPQVKQANPSVKKIETVRKPLHIRASFRQDSFNNKNLFDGYPSSLVWLFGNVYSWSGRFCWIFCNRCFN